MWRGGRSVPDGDGFPMTGTAVLQLLGAPMLLSHGEPQPLGGPRLRSILAFLALNRGRRVSSQLLIQEVWGDGAPASVGKSLTTQLSRIRTRLGIFDGELRHDTGGYQLGLGQIALDVDIVHNLVIEARSASSSGRISDAIDSLQTALRLWGEPALDGLDAPFVPAAVAALAAERNAVEDGLVALRTSVDPAGAVADLRRLVTVTPHREDRWVRLAQVLTLCGARVEALAACREARQVLADDLGLQPGEELLRAELTALHGTSTRGRVAREGGIGSDGTPPDIRSRVGTRRLPALAAAKHSASAEVSLKSIGCAVQAKEWLLAADHILAECRQFPVASIPEALTEVALLDHVLGRLHSPHETRRGYLLCRKAELLVNIDVHEARRCLDSAALLQRDDRRLAGVIQYQRLRIAESECEDPSARIRVAQRLLTNAEATGDRQLAQRAAVVLQAARLSKGDFAACARTHARLMAAADADSGSADLALQLQLVDVAIAMGTQPLGVVNNLSRAATARVAAELEPVAQSSRFLHRVTIKREWLRLPDLEPLLQVALDSSPRRLPRPLLAASRLQSGDVDGARDHLREFVVELGDLQPDWTYLATLATAIDVASSVGLADLGDSVEERLAPFAGQVVVTASVSQVLGRVDRYLGQAAVVREDLDTAVQRLALARRLDAGVGAHLWAAWAAHDEARARLQRRARGDEREARRLLDLADVVARSYESPRLAAAVASADP